MSTKVEELGQFFIDLTYTYDDGDLTDQTNEFYDDEDSKPEYRVSYGSDNVDWSSVEEIFWSYKEPVVKVLPSGASVILQEQVGGEGEGERYYLIFRVDNEDATTQFFRVDGYYASDEGTRWESAQLKEVKSASRQVVFYE